MPLCGFTNNCTNIFKNVWFSKHIATANPLVSGRGLKIGYERRIVEV